MQCTMHAIKNITNIEMKKHSICTQRVTHLMTVNRDDDDDDDGAMQH